MRIAVVQSFYSTGLPSGENRVVEDQVEALLEAGHEVLLVRQDTDDLQGALYPLRTAVNLALGTGFDPTPQLKAFVPDVVHVHNIFPNISTRWLSTWDGPIVASLHNYRLSCSNGLFFRDGEVCTDCVDRGTTSAIRHGCYRNSRLATLPVALSRTRTREHFAKVSAVVTTSELSDEVVHRYIDGSLRTVVIPNFGNRSAVAVEPVSESATWIAAGRLSPEKGFVELVEDWPFDESLLIVGDGPERLNVQRAADGRSVEVRPSVERAEFRSLLTICQGLVFPSRWFEADPQVVVEAMSLGVPVVAFHVNAVAPIVLGSGAGAVYSSGDELIGALTSVRENRDAMSEAALEEFARRWAKELWLERMTNLYEQVSRE